MIENQLVTLFTSTLYVAKDVAAKIGNRAHYNMVPQRQFNVFPRIFFTRTGKDSLADLNSDKGGYFEDTFALEVISNNATDIIAVSDNLWSSVHAHYGSISSTQIVKAMLLDNQDDDYEPKGVGGDFGLDVASFSLRVIYSST